MFATGAVDGAYCPVDGGDDGVYGVPPVFCPPELTISFDKIVVVFAIFG